MKPKNDRVAQEARVASTMFHGLVANARATDRNVQRQSLIKVREPKKTKVKEGCAQGSDVKDVPKEVTDELRGLRERSA